MVRGKCGRAARAWWELRCAPSGRARSPVWVGPQPLVAARCADVPPAASACGHTGRGNQAKVVSWLLRGEKTAVLTPRDGVLRAAEVVASHRAADGAGASIEPGRTGAQRSSRRARAARPRFWRPAALSLCLSIAQLSAPPRPRAAAPPHKIAREHSRKPCCADALRAGRWPSGQGAAAGSAEVQVRLWPATFLLSRKKCLGVRPFCP